MKCLLCANVSLVMQVAIQLTPPHREALAFLARLVEQVGVMIASHIEVSKLAWQQGGVHVWGEAWHLFFSSQHLRLCVKVSKQNVPNSGRGCIQ